MFKSIIKKTKDFLGISSNYKYYNYYYKTVYKNYEYDTYLALVNKAIQEPVITNQDIHFAYQIQFNSTLNECIKKINVPYRIKAEANDVTMVYFKIQLGANKVRGQMHFYKNKLFLGNYIFNKLDSAKKEEVLNLLYQKYTQTNFPNNKPAISNQNQEAILIEDSVDLTINYIKTSSVFFSDIKEEMALKQYQAEQTLILQQQKLYDHL